MLPEPPESDDDDHDVDEAEIRHNGPKVQVQLLVRLELLEVDAVPSELGGTIYGAKKGVDRRIQARLGACAHAEMVGVDDADVSCGIQDWDGQQAHEDDVGIWCGPVSGLRFII